MVGAILTLIRTEAHQNVMREGLRGLQGNNMYESMLQESFLHQESWLCSHGLEPVNESPDNSLMQQLSTPMQWDSLGSRQILSYAWGGFPIWIQKMIVPIIVRLMVNNNALSSPLRHSQANTAQPTNVDEFFQLPNKNVGQCWDYYWVRLVLVRFVGRFVYFILEETIMLSEGAGLPY